MTEGPILRGRRLTMRPLAGDLVGERYVRWLNDPEVNRFSQRFGTTTTLEEAEAWLAGLGPTETVFAVLDPECGHVGNVKVGPVDARNSRADISILIGEQSVWGKGIGTEAMYLAARYLFLDKGLNRVDAGSTNPGFIKAVRKLGWQVEGVLRQRVRIGDTFHDWTLLSQLRSEFAVRPDLEPG
jgi:ribosomal-protein-alanine N-acetyltransferase